MTTKTKTIRKTTTKKKVFKELDLSEFESSNDEAFSLIKNDAILNGGLSLDKINEEFEDIHKAISNTTLSTKMPWLSKIPLIGTMISTDVSVKIQGFEGKLSSVFLAYDENYEALMNSGKLYVSHINKLEKKLDILNKHLESIPLESASEKLYAHGVENLVGALTGTLTRMKINLDSAEEIRVQMKLNRPIFKEIINSLAIEKAGEIGLKAAHNSITTMTKFIQRTSTEMTDSTIAFNKEINSNKYDLGTAKTFRTNIEKLQASLQEMEQLKLNAVKSYDEYKVKNNNKALLADIGIGIVTVEETLLSKKDIEDGFIIDNK